MRCNSTYRLRYWNDFAPEGKLQKLTRCNSTYRLRYWNLQLNVEEKKLIAVATVLTVYGIETLLQAGKML